MIQNFIVLKFNSLFVRFFQIISNIFISAKDHQILKVNNNQRKKDTLKKADNRILTDELEDIKVNNDSDVSDNINLSENVESQTQTTTDPSSSVMLSSLSNEKDETPLHNQIVCNNISENQFETKNAENVRFNDVNKTEITINDQIPTSDLTIPIIKTLPDLPYKENQWSPNNPDGKKSYDKDFLLAVRQNIGQLERPEKLNNVPDIIRKVSISINDYVRIELYPV